MNTETIFFYGLFMDPDLLIGEGYSPSSINIAKLEKFNFHLGERATLKPDESESVWGTVMDLKTDELRELYSAPSVSDYMAVDVTCILEDQTEVSSKVYVLPYDYPLTFPTDTGYARKLYDISTKLSLHNDYCLKIKKLIEKIEKGGE